MPLQLAKNEFVVEDFEYARSVNSLSGRLTTTSKIIVTNKRVVEESVRQNTLSENISRSEIPLEKAKYIRTSFRRQGNFFWLFLAILGGIILCYAFPWLIRGNETAILPFMLGMILAPCGTLFFVFLRKAVVVCTISADTHVSPVLHVASFNKFLFLPTSTIHNTRVWKVEIDPAEAMELVDALGAAIIEAREFTDQAQ